MAYLRCPNSIPGVDNYRVRRCLGQLRHPTLPRVFGLSGCLLLCCHKQNKPTLIISASVDSETILWEFLGHGYFKIFLPHNQEQTLNIFIVISIVAILVYCRATQSSEIPNHDLKTNILKPELLFYLTAS